MGVPPQESYLLSIDLQKAFDTICWPYLFFDSRKMGLWPKLHESSGGFLFKPHSRNSDSRLLFRLLPLCQRYETGVSPIFVEFCAINLLLSQLGDTLKFLELAAVPLLTSVLSL